MVGHIFTSLRLYTLNIIERLVFIEFFVKLLAIIGITSFLLLIIGDTVLAKAATL